VKDHRNIKFGKALREVRKKKGWSLEKLGGITGIAANHIGVLERGEKSASVRTIDDLAKTLGCKHGDFFKYF
jgi:transcriptional regulator with XRE-family HTH domain